MVKKQLINETNKTILGFGKLLPGWNFGEGVAPDIDVIQLAINLNSRLINIGLETTNAFPGIDGEIRVTAYNESDYLEFTIEVNRTFTFVYERYDEIMVYEENLSFDDVIIRALNIIGQTWSSSEFYTPSITTVGLDVLQALPSNLHPTAVEYQSSTRIVPYKPAQPFVITSGSFITIRESVLSSGKSAQIFSQGTANLSMSGVLTGMTATST